MSATSKDCRKKTAGSFGRDFNVVIKKAYSGFDLLGKKHEEQIQQRISTLRNYQTESEEQKQSA